MPRKKIITWVAILDGKQAHFYTKGNNNHLCELNNSLTAKPIRTDLPTGRRELGRVYDSSRDGMRHIIEPHTSDRTLERVAFMHDVAVYLEYSLKRGRYNRLIVAAPPKILGFLRKTLSKNVKDSIAMEIDKDFIPLNIMQIQNQLSKIVHI